MRRTRTATVLVILAVIITGFAMANKPNDKPGINITVSPSMLVLSRYFADDVTVHSNITESIMAADMDPELLRLMGPGGGFVEPADMFLDDCGHFVFKFDAEAVKDIVEIGRQVELALVSVTIALDGSESLDEIIATDTIKVKN